MTVNRPDPNQEQMTPLLPLSLWASAKITVSEVLDVEAIYTQSELTGASWGSQAINWVQRRHLPSPLSPTSLPGP